MLFRMASRARASLAHGRDVFLFLWKQADRYVRTRMGFALLCTICGSALAIIGPAIFKVIVDELTHPRAEKWSWFQLLLLIYGLYHFGTRGLTATRGYLVNRADR